MTRSKIAISLPKAQLMRADSVSGHITKVLAEHERRESLRGLLDDLIAQYGEPSAEDNAWADQVLAARQR